MITLERLRELTLSFPDTTEESHFEKTSFKVKKKIFATYDHENKRACFKLSEVNQDVFSAPNKSIIYPVDNEWGKQGWTNIELKSVCKEVFKEVLITAYCEVAPPKLAKMVRNSET